MRTNDRELTFHVFCKEAQECGSRISSGGEEALFHVFSAKMSLASVGVFESVLHSKPHRHILCEGEWQLYKFFIDYDGMLPSRRRRIPVIWAHDDKTRTAAFQRKKLPKSEILVVVKPGELRFFLWQLEFLIKPTPHDSLYISGKEKNGKFFVFEWWLFEIGRDRNFSSLVCGANEVSAEKRRRPSERQLC